MSKNTEAADAEGVSSSIKDEIIRGLNEDLAREYKAIIQYVVFSNTLKGAEYGDIAEQLKIHASQELAHALEVARQIDYLGADPTVKGKEAEYSQDSKTMLEIDLRAEQETIKNYRERIRQAERAGEFALSSSSALRMLSRSHTPLYRSPFIKKVGLLLTLYFLNVLGLLL